MKKYFKTGYRYPKTTQEKRKYCDHKKYVRKKRSSNNLVNTYDDIAISKNYRSWKNIRKKQYKENRGTKNTIYVSSWSFSIYNIEQYFINNNISFDIKLIRRYVHKNSTINYNSFTKISWWSDKDIGIKFILNKYKCQYSPMSYFLQKIDYNIYTVLN